MKENPNTTRRDSSSGYTLMEILIALSIFSYGLLGVAAMQVTGIHGNATSRWHTKATTWGMDRIEKLMTIDYDHTDLADGSHGPVTEGLYTISWTVADDVPADNCKTITVNVAWEDRGTDKNLSLVHNRADI